MAIEPAAIPKAEPATNKHPKTIPAAKFFIISIGFLVFLNLSAFLKSFFDPDQETEERIPKNRAPMIYIIILEIT